jgi:hypothetical protein
MKVSVLLVALLLFGVLWSNVRPEFASASGSILPSSFPPIDWTSYHNYTEIVAILTALNATYPEVVDVFEIGESWQNRSIYCVRLTNESVAGPKPEVFFVGYHHAREPITAELALYFVVYAATNFGSNATIDGMLNQCEVYVVVALNVDGFNLYAANDWQRKNARPTDEDGDGRVDEDPPEDMDGDGFIEQLIDYTNPYNPVFLRWEGIDNDGDGQYGEDWIGGVDLNRNYNYSWTPGSSNPASEIYKGPAPFSEPETQAIRDFTRTHHFAYAVSFHSGSEVILYPWGYTHTAPPDQARFVDVCSDLSTLTQGTVYEQSCDLYPSYGLWDDWTYGTAGVYVLTCEIFVNETFWISEPGPYPNTYWEGGLKYNFNPFPQNIPASINRWMPVFYYVTNRTIAEATPYHDVCVNRVETDKTVVGESYVTHVNVSVKNKGFYAENLTLTVRANNVVIYTQALSISAGEDVEVAFAWNNSGLGKDRYTLRASVATVAGETRTFDNTYVGNVITVSIVGDVDGDFDVDISDVVKITAIYGLKRDDPRYNSNSDINGDGAITILDVVKCTAHYGQKYP